MADHLVDTYDENMNKTGTALKSTAHSEGIWHASIHCWIVRNVDDGYVLFQKRGGNKDLFPNALDITAAGHYEAGEEVSDGVREIVEELGLAIDFKDLIPLGVKIDIGRFRSIVNHEFCHTFLLLDDRSPDEYSLGEDEVEGLVQVSIEDGIDLFSGRRNDAQVSGVELIDGEWQPVELTVTPKSFIPRVDPYYYKIFIMAERVLEGRTDLAI